MLNGRMSDIRLQQAQVNLEYWFGKGVNFQQRIIQITGPIEPGLFDKVDAAMTVLEEDSRKSITIRINSEGGAVYEAMAIVGRLTKSSCQIITEGYGAVWSAATLILACGDKVKMSQFCWWMYHSGSYGDTGTHGHMKQEVAQFDREHKLWAKWMTDLTDHKDAKFWYNLGMHKDEYFTADQLLEKGIIDEII